VEDRDDRPALPGVQVGEEVHHLDLMADVEMDRRLVEDDDRCRLGDGDRQEHQLPLAQRQLPGVAADEPSEADPIDRRGDDRPIGRSGATERILVREPAEGDDLLDPRGERQAGKLGDDGDPARDGISRQRSKRVATDPDLAGRRSQEARDQPQEGGLAGAVRPDDRDPLAGPDLEVDFMDDVGTAVAAAHAREVEDDVAHSS